MTKLSMKVLGKTQILEQNAAHFIKEALDEFLIAEYPNTVLGSLIKLSIGLETFIKKELEEINPALINANINQGEWLKIKSGLTGTRSQNKRHLINTFSSHRQSPSDKTVDFSIAIDLFPYFYVVPKQLQKDLDDLRKYRNGLFHWKAKPREAFRLSKQSLRLFEWILAFIQKKIGWWLGGDLNIIDPMGDNRKLLRQLKKSLKSENSFNLQRRILKHNKDYQVYARIKAHLDGLVGIPDARIFKEACPACEYPELQLYESGSMRDGHWEERYLFANCKRCDFTCSDKEFESIKPKGFLSLNEIYHSTSK
jgi:hypothetical protein